MLRLVAIAGALGLCAGPAVAAQLQLDPPTLSARPDRCTPRERAQCEGMAPAIDEQLSCDQCTGAGPSVPAEIMKPTPRDTPQRNRARTPKPECDPLSTNPTNACAIVPPLDAVPRP